MQQLQVGGASGVAVLRYITETPMGGCVVSLITRVVILSCDNKMGHLSVKTYSCFITYSNRAHTEQKYDTSMPSIFTLFPEI